MLVWVHRDRSAPFLNALHFCFGLGAFLMPLIVAQTILISGDISGAYWIMAIIPLPLAIWLWRIPSPSTPKSTTDSDGEATNAWLVAGISTILFLYVGAEVSFGGWIYSYAVTLGLENQVSAAYLTSVFWGALTIGRLLAVPIATRIRPRALLLMDLLGCIACLICMIALWQSNRVLWIGTIALGLSMASFFPTTLAYAARHLAVRGSVTRWFFVGSGVGGMLLPWLIGQLIESHSAQVVLVAILADLVLALIIFVISNRYPSVEVEMENQWEQAAD